MALSIAVPPSVAQTAGVNDGITKQTVERDSSSLRIAVASNFYATAKLLIERYQRSSSTELSLLVASTGKHTAQIQYGLAVDLFLAADQHSPSILEKAGFAVPGTRFNYASGRLVLWSADASLVDANGQVLVDEEFAHIAIANPKLAPYGRAAMQLLSNKGVIEQMAAKLVRGDSIGQAFQFVSSGNAEIGLLAYSQILSLAQGSYWLVPSDLHEPILQTGVIIKDSQAVRNLVAFLQSEEALSLIEAQGYSRP